MSRYPLTLEAVRMLVGDRDPVEVLAEVVAGLSASAPPRPRFKLFSFVEQQVIDLLAGAPGAMTRKEIARALRLSALGAIRGILANLVEREALSWDRKTGGYSIPAEAVGAERVDESTGGIPQLGTGPAASPGDVELTRPEADILAVLAAERGALTADEIADRLGVKNCTRLRHRLARMRVPLGVLDWESQAGYLITDRGRQALEAWQSQGLDQGDQPNGQAPSSPAWSPLSGLTLRVVRLLTERVGWMTREEIAAELGQAPEGDLRPLLTDLAKRGALESSSKRGYSLAIPDDQKPDQYRARLLAWVETQPRPEEDDRPAGRTRPTRPRADEPLSDSELAQRIAEARAAKACQCGLD